MMDRIWQKQPESSSPRECSGPARDEKKSFTRLGEGKS
jgi:hypothetical protein